MVRYVAHVSLETSPVALIGRERSLELLQDAFDAAARSAEVVLVEGEGGIGKTALLEAFAVEVADDDVAWFGGGAIDVGGEPIPYGPVTELLRSIRRQRGAVLADDDVSRLVRTTAKDRMELFDYLLDTLDRVRQSVSRVVVAIEDLHWADDATLDLIAFLARNLAPGFLLVLTHRPDDSSDHVRSVLAMIGRDRGRRIALQRLGREQVRELVGAVRGQVPSEPELEEIYLRGEGNPFLIGELAAADQQRVPTSVRDVLLARTHGLTDNGWAVAELAAVIGARVPHDVLSSAATDPSAAVLAGSAQLNDAIRQVVGCGLLAADGDDYLFRHALSREVLLDRLLPTDRRRLHAAVARTLAQQPGASTDVRLATEIASHWYLARSPQQSLAAIDAARLCMSVFAFGEAWRQYGRAMEGRSLESSDDAELMLAAAEAARWSGALPSAIELGHQALAIATDSATRARLQERLGQYLWEAGRTDDARNAFAEAAAELDDSEESVLSAEVAASSAHLNLMSGDAATARDLAVAAIELAARTGALSAEGRARITYGVSLAFLGELESGADEVRRGQALVSRHGDLDERRRADSNLAYVLLMSGQTAAACEVSLTSLAFLRRHGLDASAGSALTSNTVVLLRLTGRWDEADRLAQEALASDIPAGQARYIHLARAELAISRGDIDLARDQIAAAESLLTEPAQMGFVTDLRMAEAELALISNDLDHARETMLELVSGLPESAAPRMVLQACALGLRVEADIAQLRPGRTSSGADSVSVYRAILSEVVEATTPENAALGLTARAEVCRAEGVSDPALWMQATTAWTGLGHPLQTAYCQLRLAESMLAQPGQARAAAEVLRSCHLSATELGARLLVREAAALARRARIELADPAAEGAEHPASPAITPPRPAAPFGLTPRELEVLRAITDGDTNRDIARTLFLSPRTVGVHVSNVLAKLGVSTRGQAAAIATRLALFADEPVAP